MLMLFTPNLMSPVLEESHCRHSVSNHYGPGSRQCERKIVVLRKIPVDVRGKSIQYNKHSKRKMELGFCTQHDPERVNARSKAREQAREKRWAASDAQQEQSDLAEQIVETLRSHLDARGQLDWLSCSAKVTKLVKKHVKLDEKAKV